MGCLCLGQMPWVLLGRLGKLAGVVLLPEGLTNETFLGSALGALGLLQVGTGGGLFGLGELGLIFPELCVAAFPAHVACGDPWHLLLPLRASSFCLIALLRLI